MKKTNQSETKVKQPQLWLIIGIAVLVLIIAVYIMFQATNNDEPEAEVITVSTLEKIINVSELSTFTAVYNGIAEVMNVKKTEKVDYYVSYEARVDAGIDFEKILVSVDNENKAITVDIPEVFITDINVDIASLDFIFVNDKANTSTVTQEAFKACEVDVQLESEQQTAIFDLAKQNAVNVLTALINPIIEQLDVEYTLVIE